MKRIVFFTMAVAVFLKGYSQSKMLITKHSESISSNTDNIIGQRSNLSEDHIRVNQVSQPGEKEGSVIHTRGFGHYTEIGALAATKNRPDNVTTAAFSFQTVNGYTFSRWLFTGIGVAADLYATQTNIPVFGSLRGNLIKEGRFIPFYFLDGGYGIDITSSTTDISYKGGAMFAGGIGFKIPVNNGVGFMVSFGYRMQKGSTVQSGIKQDYTNNRIALRAGFYL